MGRILDGVADHMEDYPIDRTFDVADAPEPDRAEVVRVRRESGAEVLLNYLPVGSQEATAFYATCELAAGVAFANNLPVFIPCVQVWATRYPVSADPIIGDTIKDEHGVSIEIAS